MNAAIEQRRFPSDYETRDGVAFPKKANQEPFTYSDGDQSENYLIEVISKAGDRTLFSPEILSSIRDWPSLYHLSPKRANLLRPFSRLLRGSVLEIGAGCGAITRFLGENGGSIIAVEGSARRAGITRLRTVDLDNVSIVCDRIENFAPDERFDVATAVGVLEYAAVFNPDKADPHADFLRRIGGMLKPNGVVILAIENKLGLKYFAGAREDHTGRAFHGINDAYRDGSVATFGATELARLLDRSGLNARVWFLPCPDYKLPTTIMSAPLVRRHAELAATLAAQAALADPQRPVDPTFSLETGWAILGENGLLGELANSFLVVAGSSPEAVLPYQTLDELAWHYSVDRHPAFAKASHFVSSGSGLAVEGRPLTDIAAPTVPIRHILGYEPCWQGRNWWKELVDILNRPNWSISQVAAWAQVWIDAFIRECGVGALNGETFLKHVDGRCFDLMPLNMLRGPEGDTHFVNQEWRLIPTVELGYLVVRGLSDSLRMVPSCATPIAGTPHGINLISIGVLAELGIMVARAEFDRYALMEAQAQAWVHGRSVPDLTADMVQAQWNLVIPVREPVERAELARQQRRLRETIEELQIANQQSDQARHQMSANLEAACRAGEQHASQVAHLTAQREEDGRKRRELEREITATRTLLRESQDQLQRLSGDLDSAVQRAAAIAKQRDADISHTAMLEERLAAGQAMLQERQEEVQLLTAELAGVQREMAAVVVRHAADTARLETRETELTRRVAGLQQELTAALTTVANQHASLLQMEKERIEVREAASRAQSDRDDASRKIAQLFSEIGTLQSLTVELQAALAKATGVEEEAARLRAELDAARAACARNIEERNEQARAAEIARAQVDELRATTHRQERALAALAQPGRFSPARLWTSVALAFQRLMRSNRPRARDADAIRAARLFNALEYLTRYPDVAESGLDPLEHYLMYGEAEGRVAHPVFDAGYYLQKYPEVREIGSSALAHYVIEGIVAGFDPHPLFDTDWYLQHNPDVAASAINPLHHYTTIGWREGRDPHPDFDTSYYLDKNPDVAAADESPLVHYIHHGMREGRGLARSGN